MFGLFAVLAVVSVGSAASMGDVKQERRQLIQDLRRIAGSVGVERVFDNANRTKVIEMVQNLFRRSCLEENDRKTG